MSLAFRFASSPPVSGSNTMSGVGHSWDVFTTDSPYTAVLEGLPTQLALALRRLGFAVPGNLAAFVDDFEYTETQLDQTVSGADTSATVGVGTVSAYTSGDPKRRRFGKSSPLLSYPSSILHSSSIPSSEVIASVTSIEDKMSIAGASLPFASKGMRRLLRCGHRSRKNEIEGELKGRLKGENMKGWKRYWKSVVV